MWGADNLIIDGNIYSLMCYQTDTDYAVYVEEEIAEVIAPFANFGYYGQYTLYEIKTDLPYKVYIDNVFGAVFCENEHAQECLQYYKENRPECYSHGYEKVKFDWYG